MVIDVDSKIVEIRGTKVILDCDVASLYGVETKEVNRSVKNNPDKFPDGYIMIVDENEKGELVKNFHQFNSLKHSYVPIKAFTEKGLYMLATILKSPQATMYGRQHATTTNQAATNQPCKLVRVGSW